MPASDIMHLAAFGLSPSEAHCAAASEVNSEAHSWLDQRKAENEGTDVAMVSHMIPMLCCPLIPTIEL
jgi:hypothetical protein